MVRLSRDGGSIYEYAGYEDLVCRCQEKRQNHPTAADRHQCKLRRDWTDNTEECPDTMGCGTIGILYSVSDAGITSLD